MAVNVTYREANPVVPTATTIKNSPLSNQEIDGNFKSIKDAIDPLGTSDGAALVGFAPTGGVVATTVQAAIAELDTEKASSTNLAASGGSGLIGYDGGTIKDALDKAKPIADYVALRAYTGNATQVRITSNGTAGFFYYDASDTSSTDNGGTVIVSSNGKRWKRFFDGAVNVRWFGASSSALPSVNFVAIQACADYSASSGAPISGAAGTYIVNATLNINCMGDLSEMTISADSATVSPVLRFGTTSGSPTSYKIIKLPRVSNATKPSDGWNGSGIGIELANCNTCNITIPGATGFAYGVTAGGYNSGFAYNDVHVMFLYGNKVNLRLKPATGSGWSNENTFHGGRYGHNPADATSWVGSRDILIEPFDASAVFPPDNNLFIRPSIESNVVEYMIDVNGTFNTFLNARYEGTAKRVRIYSSVENSSNSNLFIGGFQANQVIFTFDGARAPYNSAFFGRQNHVDTTGFGFNIVNRSGDTYASPHIQGFVSTETALTKNQTSADWSYRLHSTGIAFKGQLDGFPLVELKTNGHLYFGSGTAAATNYIRQYGTAIRINVGTSFHPNTDNANELGVAANRWSSVYSESFRPGAGAVKWTSGAGSPEAVLTAPVGSLFTRTDGAPGSTFYVKETGTGNTGWVAK